MTTCPECGRRQGRGWRRRFTAAERAAIAHQALRDHVKQVVLARIHGCSQTTISRIVVEHR